MGVMCILSIAGIAALSYLGGLGSWGFLYPVSFGSCRTHSDDVGDVIVSEKRDRKATHRTVRFRFNCN